MGVLCQERVNCFYIEQCFVSDLVTCYMFYCSEWSLVLVISELKIY